MQVKFATRLAGRKQSEIFNRMEVVVGKRLLHLDRNIHVDQTQKLARDVIAKS